MPRDFMTSFRDFTKPRQPRKIQSVSNLSLTLTILGYFVAGQWNKRANVRACFTPSKNSMSACNYSGKIVGIQTAFRDLNRFRISCCRQFDAVQQYVWLFLHYEHNIMHRHMQVDILDKVLWSCSWKWSVKHFSDSTKYLLKLPP